MSSLEHQIVQRLARYPHVHAELIKRMLFNEADFMCYRDRMLAERRKAWIGA